ncbi:carboxylesterase family protein [Streptomyces cellulosae]|uniref:Carboxylesterase family protein n=1 Tax=Streptomyces cellulosae TaxID=1968 RepID=A0ABW7YBS1_STRCE
MGGVPFATAERYRRPVVADFDPDRPYDRKGVVSVQPDSGDWLEADSGTGEDCLNLNVWAPEQPDGKALPVAVYIHGGGFEYGANTQLLIDDINRALPHQLANVLPCFYYLRDKLGMSLVFCGIGASRLLHQARVLAGDLTRVSEENRYGSSRRAARRRPPRSPNALLPVTWLDALPLDTEDHPSSRSVSRSPTHDG